jgi:hypothetical protein
MDIERHSRWQELGHQVGAPSHGAADAAGGRKRPFTGLRYRDVRKIWYQA